MRSFFRRFWIMFFGRKTLGRWLRRYGALIGTAEAMLFWLSARGVGWKCSFNIAVGGATPFLTHAGATQVALALFSWLLVPAVAGAVVAALLTDYLKPVPESEVDEHVRRVLIEMRDKAEL